MHLCNFIRGYGETKSPTGYKLVSGTVVKMQNCLTRVDLALYFLKTIIIKNQCKIISL